MRAARGRTTVRTSSPEPRTGNRRSSASHAAVATVAAATVAAAILVAPPGANAHTRTTSWARSVPGATAGGTAPGPVSAPTGRHRPAPGATAGMRTAGGSGTAPQATTGGAPGSTIPGRYIVTYRAGRTPSAVQATGGVRARRVYRHAVRGFAAALDARQVAELRADPAVASVVPDVVIRTAATQLNPDWGLDRIDQPTLPLDRGYAAAGDGTGVTAYVIDTGLRSTHREFTGRVGAGVNYALHSSDGSGTVNPADTSDCDGHGTHVAGSIAGSTYGVAKRATVVPVRVLDCAGSGTLSDVIAGVDWVTAHHAAGAIANMSLGGPVAAGTELLDQAVAASIAAGVTYAVAAGNEGDLACDYSPAGTPAAITVGASDSGDHAAWYSNYGSCVDLYAPGSAIASAWASSDTATNTISGTSMASPHVAGVAALFRQAHPGDTPDQLRARIISTARSGVLADTLPQFGDPNLLLQRPREGTLATDGAAPVVSGLGASTSGSTITLGWTGTDPQVGGDPATSSGIKGYAATLDHSPTGTVPPVLTLLGTRTSATRLADGTWYAHVRAEDLSGRWSGVVTSRPLVIDVQAPRLTGLRVAPSAPNRYQATVSASDAGSGLATITVVWSRSRTTVSGAWQTVRTPATGLFRSPWLSSGTWYLHVRAMDKRGHLTGWTTTGALTMPVRFVSGSVTPGARCSTAVRGRYGYSRSGAVHRCASSRTDARILWRAV